MSNRITCMINGVEYLYKEINHKDAARCLGCAAKANGAKGLCSQLGDCSAGIWAVSGEGPEDRDEYTCFVLLEKM